jgi:drug/metabolite transporter superfamily protein YnfA
MPETDELSPKVIRDLHADMVRQKRRSLILASPLLLLAAFGWIAAISDPVHFGGLFFFVFLVFAAIGGVAYEWITLRRTDPMALNGSSTSPGRRKRSRWTTC